MVGEVEKLEAANERLRIRLSTALGNCGMHEENERQALEKLSRTETYLRTAAGVLSTRVPFTKMHPEEVLHYIIEKAEL